MAIMMLMEELHLMRLFDDVVVVVVVEVVAIAVQRNNGKLKLFMRIMYIYRTIIDSRVAQAHYESTNPREREREKVGGLSRC